MPTVKIIKAVAGHLLFAMAPMLAIILANFLVEPDRCWFTNTSVAQEYTAWAAFVAWSFLSLRLFIVPLEQVELGGAK